ncbi:MAG: ROK family protein [Thermoguttaceae bacterium]
MPMISVKEAVAPLYFGVDVGGTSIKVGLVDDLGRVVHIGEVNESGVPSSFLAVQTEACPQTAVRLMKRVIDQILAGPHFADHVTRSQIGGIGLGLPGVIDTKTRRLVQLPNLRSWVGFAMCDELSHATSLPVAFCNDANAAAYGEYWVGSGSCKASSLALLTLGTGIGTGIIIDGKTLEGATGRGGECGHLVIDCTENARLCGCGQRGHLEAYASALAVARRTIAIAEVTQTSLRDRITPDTQLSAIPRLVCEEAEKGDQVAIDIIAETARYLSLGIVSILNTVDPECILIGGAMTFGGRDSTAGRRFLDKLRSDVYARCFPAIVPTLQVEFATLGNDAGFIGAAGLSRASIGESR